MKYQVTGECAHIVATDHSGVSATVLLYKGAPVPDNIDPDRLKHLLRVHLVAEVGEVPLAPNAAVQQDGRVGIPTLDGPDGDTGDGMYPQALTDEQRTAQREQAEATVEDEQKQATARAKLAEIGGTPDGRHSEAVWIEYAVSQGTDRTEATKAGKAELQKLYAAK